MIHGANGNGRKNGKTNGNGSASTVDALWRGYKSTYSIQLRNKLVENYMGLVEHNAWRMVKRLSDKVEKDELVSAGVFGLIDAVEKYDPSRKARFETYCATRVRGAMIDWVREMDWVPRTVRKRGHKIESVVSSLEQELKRSPVEDELREALEKKCGLRKAKETITDRKVVMVYSFSNKVGENEDGSPIHRGEIIEDKSALLPERKISREFLKKYITGGLTRTERLVIMLRYYEELTYLEIGNTIGLSESRTSQIHSKLISNLKEGLLNFEETQEEFFLKN